MIRPLSRGGQAVPGLDHPGAVAWIVWVDEAAEFARCRRWAADDEVEAFEHGRALLRAGEVAPVWVARAEQGADGARRWRNWRVTPAPQTSFYAAALPRSAEEAPAMPGRGEVAPELAGALAAMGAFCAAMARFDAKKPA